MKALTIEALYTLEETIAKDLFQGVVYPWEVLPKIHDFILELGKRLPEDEYEKVGEDVWIAKSAKVFPSAYIHAPGWRRCCAAPGGWARCGCSGWKWTRRGAR